MKSEDVSDIKLPVELGMAPLGGFEGVANYTHEHFAQADVPSVDNVEDDPAYKPFSFAIRPAPDDQIHIRYGVLVAQSNKMIIDEDGLVYQTGIGNLTTHIPDNFKETNEDGDIVTDDEGNDQETAGNRYLFTTLDWRGDVYLYWETDPDGVVTMCDIRGPDEPDHIGLPTDTIGKFFVKLGTCDDYNIPALKQYIASDVFWPITFGIDASNDASDSAGSTSSSSSSSTSTSDDGSDKSTAIVPMKWHKKGYGALFTMESNEVLFEFLMRRVEITGRTTSVKIDERYIQVCDSGTLTVAGAPCGDRAGSVGAVVRGRSLILTASRWPWLRPKNVTLKLTGIRKGFSHMDMPERSREQFVANEKFINSAYPAE